MFMYIMFINFKVFDLDGAGAHKLNTFYAKHKIRFGKFYTKFTTIFALGWAFNFYICFIDESIAQKKLPWGRAFVNQKLRN